MIYLENIDSRPLYQQIYDAIRQDILSGSLSEGTALQPIRTLADELCVSKNTVEHAYHQLMDEGLIRAAKGSGYYVEDLAKVYLHTKSP